VLEDLLSLALDIRGHHLRFGALRQEGAGRHRQRRRDCARQAGSEHEARASRRAPDAGDDPEHAPASISPRQALTRRSRTSAGGGAPEGEAIRSSYRRCAGAAAKPRALHRTTSFARRAGSPRGAWSYRCRRKDPRSATSPSAP
jgi:hypothetical protein